MPIRISRFRIHQREYRFNFNKSLYYLLEWIGNLTLHHRERVIPTLELKGFNCHFKKWQLDPINTKDANIKS